MLNKYAKQKKRRRNFSIDRSHHYEKILEESAERKSSGFLKKAGLVLLLSAIVFLSFQVRQRMETHGKGYIDVGNDDKDEPAAKEKAKKKKK